MLRPRLPFVNRIAKGVHLLLAILALPAAAGEPIVDKAHELLRRAQVAQPPADALGGVTLQAKPPSGFTCAAGDCTKHANVAGEDGTLTLTLCGPVVQQVYFTVAYADQSRVAEAAPGEVVSFGTQLSPDPSRSGLLATTRIQTALERAGWICGMLTVSDPIYTAESGAVSQQEECYSPDGRHRTLGTTVGKDRTSGVFALVLLQSSSPSACTSGL